MKRTITTFALTAALLLTLGVGSSFARNTNNGDDNVNAYFHKDFRQVELLDTKTSPDYTRFTFKMSGMILTAFYSNKGELLAVTHNIPSTQLPLQLLIQVRRNYSGYWISDLFEYSANGSTSYFLTLENADNKITLRSNEGDWETYNKTTKQ
jgi:hypothetical protein